MRNPAYRRLVWNVLTLGPLGTSLPAPGTWASAATVALLLLLQPYLPHAFALRVIVLCAIGVAIAVAGASALARLARPGVTADHPSIVLDEVAGMFIAAAPGGVWTSGTIVHLFLAFVIFRIYDIAKPFGIRSVDRRGTPASVFADDVCAGAYAAATLTALAVLLY